MPKNTEKLIIIDSNALIHRAFHALPPMSNKDGVMVNAVYGFTSILLKTIKDIKPDYIVATFDMKGKTLRHEEFEQYKAGRAHQPDELYHQMPIVKEVLKTFNIPIFEKAGYEADDLIGTIATLKSVDRSDIESIILTGDKDMFQLVDDNTFVLAPAKGMSEPILYDKKTVADKMNGITPGQIVDYKALRGDPSDNIPGVKGIGDKGATTLLNEFKNLDNIYKNIESDNIKDRTKKLLTEHKEDAYLSQKLATIITDVPIKFDLENCQLGGFAKSKIVRLFQELNFTRLMSQLTSLDIKTAPVSGDQVGLFDMPAVEEKKKTAKQTYILVNTDKLANEFIIELKKQKEFCFDTETTDLDTFAADLLGISFSWKKNTGYYLPINTIQKYRLDLNNIFADDKIKKIGQNIKYDLEVLEQADFELNGIYFDTMLASYLLNPGSRGHNLTAMAFNELGYQMQPIEDLIGKGKDQINMSKVPVEKVSHYACEDADITWQLYKILKEQLDDEDMFGLFQDMDMPMIRVLATIEENGVNLDTKFLQKISEQTGKEIIKLKKKIYQVAGREFNVASPMQLKEILFQTLEISTAGLGKTKTGISTAAGELEKLKGEHKIIDLILDFRELSKLQNTYLEALPSLVSEKDGRVHGSFNQAVAATGRLSSSNPNLQNIPIRTERGRQIRKAFVANPGYKIIKADYSQIELRIVASLADDKNMIKAFEGKTDIHTTTAAAIGEINIDEVTPTLRSQAKEVNFGVLYGMGAWGLAKRTGIENDKAKKFIDKYFKTYKQVKIYIENTKEIARDQGYVETFYGRRRYIPEINSGMGQVRASGERMAINMPIQGTAADLMKLAMISIHKELPDISPETKMILQVHDELVFEVPEKDVGKVAKAVEDLMNGVYKLKTPIETEVSVGDNWGETKTIK
jgi:DNA polymerase-1